MLALRRIISAQPTRSIAARSFSSDYVKDHERAMEASYFNKEDEKALRKLLKKMKSQTDIVDTDGSKDHVAHDVDGLKSIIGDAKLSDAQVQALLKWKHEH